MNSQQLIDKLGYSDSPAFLQGERLREHHGYSFFFAQAEKAEDKEHSVKKHCNLKGVYTLLYSPDKLSSSSLTPVVYVCEADNETEAAKIHRRVWNQNIVPFLIVVTPRNIRLYSGFEYNHKQSDKERVLEVAINANEVLSKLSALKSESIDSGDIWKQRPISVEGRVDRHLLANLETLSEVLTGNEYNLPIEHAHTLIGKYIYLKYLRDRGILSDKRLEKAEIDVKADDIFGSNANKNKLYQLEIYLNNFLNGSVFPLPCIKNIRADHVKAVASAFKGGDPESGQQVLFDMYDFSYVPIETLSVVYQQFLHAKGQGRGKGAYYTPVHLVNFIIDELDTKKPLKEGMKIFDSSCGSGAFLVQCYRRLVESIVRGKRAKLKPTELRNLLVDHIFGLDADKEACRVAELSLSLTLLDYIDPPDLSKTRFQLPNLHNINIFHCEEGFFDDKSLWTKSIPEEGYNWIVGNPPWKDKYDLDEPSDENALNWINSNKRQYPVGKQQLAEAFAWKITQLLNDDGQCGILMPALTLFKKNSKSFRSSFFSQVETWCVVNFANLRHCLFEGADNPAAAFFFSGKKDWDKAEHYITTYAPFAVDQSSQLSQKVKPKKLWAVFVNYSIINEIPLRDVGDGSSVPWKMAMWGTHRDKMFVDSILKHSTSLRDMGKKHGLDIRQGPSLRPEDSGEPVDYIPELRGVRELDIKKLKGERELFSIPEQALSIIPRSRCYLRKRTGKKSLLGCRPPHIIVDAAMRFAIYSDEYIVFNAKPLGIAGARAKKVQLKAITMLLNSHFIQYMDIALSGYLGVERDRSGEKYVIESFPIPAEVLFEDNEKLMELSTLHDDIVEADKRERQEREEENTGQRTLWREEQEHRVMAARGRNLPSKADLLKQMNIRVYDLLGIRKKQRWLIEDMLNVRIKLNDGKIAEEATNAVDKGEIYEFARIFQDELDLFLDHSGKRKVHKVKVLYSDNVAVMIVDHLRRSSTTKPEVVEVQNCRIRHELHALQDRLTEKRCQWMYFTRCLRIYEGRRTYIFKPRQRLYWLKSQALAEADEFIAEKLEKE